MRSIKDVNKYHTGKQPSKHSKAYRTCACVCLYVCMRSIYLKSHCVSFQMNRNTFISECASAFTKMHMCTLSKIQEHIHHVNEYMQKPALFLLSANTKKKIPKGG